MAINYTRLFTSLGLVCGALNEINAYRGTTVAARKASIVSQFGTVAAYGDLVTGVYAAEAAAATAEDSFVSYLGTLAESILVNEVVADRPLNGTDLDSVLTELVRQMTKDSETLAECPGTVTVAGVGSPAGDHHFVFGVKDPLTGRTTDYLVPDVYQVKCTADRSQGGTAYSESFTLTGKPADAKPTDSTYPSGTGLSLTVQAIDPNTNSGELTDGSFDGTWTGAGNNTPPTPWAVYGSTVAGTHAFRSTGVPRASGYSLRLTGDGTVVPKVRQVVALEANASYTVHARLNKVLDPGTDWAVSLILTDASGAVVAGNGAYSNVVSSVACSTIASDWSSVVTGEFCTPAVLPSGGLYLEVRLHQSGSTTTAPASTGSCDVDFVACHPAAPIYAGGPVLNAYSGAVEGVVGDLRTATVALTTGVPSTYLVRGIDRLLGGGLASATVRVPTTAAATPPTQPDSLVV